MIKLALIGKEIKHSKSQEVYEDILNHKISYTLIDCETTEAIPPLDELFRQYAGVSITSPYKKHFLNDVTVSEEFSDLNAINCIRKKDDIFEAINTDYLAVKDIISSIIRQHGGINVLILGDGAMSNITTKLLRTMNINFKVCSRKRGDRIEDLDLTDYFRDSTLRPLVINTCSRGFIFRGKVDKNILFWDYNYSQQVQRELLSSKAMHYIDGQGLLKEQARYALRFWGIA